MIPVHIEHRAAEPCQAARQQPGLCHHGAKQRHTPAAQGHVCTQPVGWMLWVNFTAAERSSPAGRLKEVPEELLVPWEGGRRAGSHEALRLDQTLLQTLQPAQAVRSQNAQHISVRGLAERASRSGLFAHLGENSRAVKGSDSIFGSHCNSL